MKRYSVNDFDHLNIHQRCQLVFKTGKYVMKRRRLHYIFALYTVGKEFIEVRFNDAKNIVEGIEKPEDNHLFLYAREAYKDGLTA